MTGHKSFAILRAEIRKDAVRTERVAAHKSALERGLLLAEARKSRGQTQRAVAEAMGVSQANISRIEHGEDAQISTLQRYAKALGGSLNVQIIFEEDERAPA